MKRSALTVSAALLALTGCAGADETFPSLLPRAVERPAPDPDAPQATPTGPADPALLARLAGMTAAAQAGDTAFRAELTDARRAVAAAGGARPGDDRWMNAQQAISRLEAAQGEIAGALVDLDTLEREQATAGAQPSYAADHAAILAARAEIDRLAVEQRAAFSALAGSLPPP